MHCSDHHAQANGPPLTVVSEHKTHQTSRRNGASDTILIRLLILTNAQLLCQSASSFTSSSSSTFFRSSAHGASARQHGGCLPNAASHLLLLQVCRRAAIGQHEETQNRTKQKRTGWSRFKLSFRWTRWFYWKSVVHRRWY